MDRQDRSTAVLNQDAEEGGRETGTNGRADRRTEGERGSQGRHEQIDKRLDLQTNERYSLICSRLNHISTGRHNSIL